MDRSDHYVGLLLDIASKGMLLATFLKVFGWDNWVIVGSLLVIVVIVYIVWGHIDLKIGLYRTWNTINNTHNEELQQILKKVNGK